MKWYEALLGLAVVGLAAHAVQQRRTIEEMQARINSLAVQINRFENSLVELRLEYQADVNAVNAQIQSVIMEISTLKRQNSTNPEMMKALDDIEFRMREMIRKKRETLQYARQ